MASVATPAGTSQADLDRIALRLKDRAAAFAALPMPGRLRLARQMRAGYAGVAAGSVRAAWTAKRIVPGTATEGEDWTLGPLITLLNFRLLISSLESIAARGSTPIGRASNTIDGRRRVAAFPLTRLDAVAFARIHGEVHLQPGATVDQRASFYRSHAHEGKVALVLGGGNVNAIPPLDVLTKMFNEGKVCLLKMNPVNAYLGPFLAEAFRDAVEAGFFAIVYGGAEEGAYLARHAAIDEIHLTGSDRTHDALVWGPPGPEREGRRTRNHPLLAKPMTSELGNISPVIVVPGPYSDRQLAWQAENIAGGVTNNASFNCNANKLLVTSRQWSDRGRLVGNIEKVLASTPARFAYYPGARERYQGLTRGRARIDTFGGVADGALPWTVIPDVRAGDPGEAAFSIEPFCAILSETALEAGDPAAFLEEAVRFVNERVWGTLVASIVIHPTTLAEPGMRDALERAIAELRYGTVGVNVWGAYGFALGLPWGGYPGATLTNVQSGMGFVHNTSMFEGIEKAVVRQPITNFPKPLHFPSHRTAGVLAPRFAALEATGSWSKLLPVVAAAARG